MANHCRVVHKSIEYDIEHLKEENKKNEAEISQLRNDLKQAVDAKLVF